MKKKIITTMLAAAMLTAGTTNAYAANPLDGYDITIYDQTDPAVFASGRDWPITTWYFFDEDHNIIGSMSGKDSLTIAQQYESVNPDGRWEFWFPKVFNDYRGLNDNTSPVSSAPKEEKQIIDTEEWAIEVIELTVSRKIKFRLEGRSC